MLFFRSADWRPFCKTLLAELQRAQQRFRERGIGLVGISYDSRAILKYFSGRYGVTFSLAADPKSQIIRRFGALNPRGAGFSKGMAIPRFVHVGADESVKQMFFDDNALARYTANNVIAKVFAELIDTDEGSVPALHLQLKLTQSDTVVVPGNRVTPIAEISLPPDVHVYAPGVHRYKPIASEPNSTSHAILRTVRYPHPKVTLLPVIHERVPVLEGKFRITGDVTVAFDRDFIEKVMKGPPSGTLLTLTADLSYQACDNKACYPHDAVPVSWQLTVKPLDHSRAPEAIRHE